MIIHNVGYHHKHDSDFKIERPSGTGDFLFLLVVPGAIFAVMRIIGQAGLTARTVHLQK